MHGADNYEDVSHEQKCIFWDDARADDADSFDWSPPGDASTYKWICPSWTRELFDFERSKVDVTFMQVFEP